MTYSHAKSKVSGQSVPKIQWKQTDGQTDAQTEATALPPSLMRSVTNGVCHQFVDTVHQSMWSCLVTVRLLCPNTSKLRSVCSVTCCHRNGSLRPHRCGVSPPVCAGCVRYPSGCREHVPLVSFLVGSRWVRTSSGVFIPAARCQCYSPIQHKIFTEEFTFNSRVQWDVNELLQWRS